MSIAKFFKKRGTFLCTIFVIKRGLKLKNIMYIKSLKESVNMYSKNYSNNSK